MSVQMHALRTVLLGCMLLVATVKSTATWTPVNVSQTRFDSALSFLNFEKIPGESVFSSKPFIECDLRSWCFLVCQEEGTEDFLLWDLLVMPFTEDPLGQPTYVCWTNRLKNVLLEPYQVSIAYAYPFNSLSPSKISENLLETTFDRDSNQGCYRSAKTLHTDSTINRPFVVFDLGKIMKVEKVVIGALPHETNSGIFFRNVEVRVGLDLVHGEDFSSYQLLGYFNDEATGAHFMYETDAIYPIFGRLVSVQSIQPDPTELSLQFCYIEIVAEA